MTDGRHCCSLENLVIQRTQYSNICLLVPSIQRSFFLQSQNSRDVTSFHNFRACRHELLIAILRWDTRQRIFQCDAFFFDSLKFVILRELTELYFKKRRPSFLFYRSYYCLMKYFITRVSEVCTWTYITRVIFCVTEKPLYNRHSSWQMRRKAPSSCADIMLAVGTVEYITYVYTIVMSFFIGAFKKL